MAEGLNRAMLIGNLGAEPELRYTPNNRAVLKFRIATTESYLTESGERKEITQWHNIVLWGKRAEALAKILTKGTQVYVEGRIDHRTYDDKDGVKRNITEITATNLILLGRRNGTGSEPSAKGTGPTSAARGGSVARSTTADRPSTPSTPESDDFPPDDYGIGSDDDIPF